MRSTRLFLNRAPALLLVALLLAGCSLIDQTKTANNNARSSPASTPGSAEANTANAGATPPVSTIPAIASADGDKPGIRVEVQELKRTSGDTVTLKFAMINDSDKETGTFGYEYGDPEHSVADVGGVGGVHLIDAAGKKKYFVVRDTENACVCSRKVPSIQSKSRANLFAKFPAPPADVEKISVVIPHFNPMDDVPISK